LPTASDGAGPSSSSSPYEADTGGGGGGGSGGGGKGKGKAAKPKKQTLHELMNSGLVHPQNAWTQKSRGPAASAGLGQWGKGGGAKLAKQEAAVNESWGSKK
jgi:hypothetical protein